MTFRTPRETVRRRSEKFERPKSLAFENSQQRIQKKSGAATRLRKTVQQEHSRSTNLGGFHVKDNDTTAVLSPISEQAEETETSSQPANALSVQDGQAKTTDRATS